MSNDLPSHRNSSRRASFRHAFAGMQYAFQTQPNTWIHAVATLVVLFAGLWLGLSMLAWVAIVLAVGIVWVLEFINTSIEAAVDLAQPEIHPLAKAAKDTAAAAVLTGAITAALVGLLVLGPPLLEKLRLLGTPPGQ
mgnify:CR=1 FL=1